MFPELWVHTDDDVSETAQKYIKATKIHETEGSKYLRPSAVSRNAILRERAKIGSKWRGCAQYGNKAP